MSQIFQKLGSGQPDFATENFGAWSVEFAFGSLEPTALIQRAKIDQLTNSYARPSDANLANYNISGRIHYFCDDTSFTDRGAGFQEWTREVATLPANFNDYETFSYAFPGYWGARSGFTTEPTSKLVREFFLVGNTAAGANYNTAGDIPQYRAQNYAWASTFESVTNINNVVSVAGAYVILDGYLANTNSNAILFASVPSLSTYQNWVQSDQNVSNNTWSIEAASSTLEHLRGPIWMRTRRFVKAQ